MRKILIVLVLFPAMSLANEQDPKRIAQCGGLTAAIATFIDTPSRRETVEQYAALWTEAAVSAGGTGMIEVINAAAQEWESYGIDAMEHENTKGWISYCGRLARRIGLTPDAEAIKNGTYD